jgi:ubiquinone/menaquinone biosynthesis C-methylase UbiE
VSRATCFRLPVNVYTDGMSNQNIDILLNRGNKPHRPTLESRVAYQFELDGNTVGFYSGSMKNRLTLDWLQSIVANRNSKVCRILDIGCAHGNMMLMMNALNDRDQSIEYYGMDLDPSTIAYGVAFAAEVDGYSNCRFSVGNLDDGLPFPPNYFDAVYIGDVLEHMEDPGATLDELQRVLTKSGVIIVSTPILDSLFKRLSVVANKLSGGKLFKEYYAGKSTDLDENGNPIMITTVGHDHISELPAKQLFSLFESKKLEVVKFRSMSVNSGSLWFDRHLFLTSFIFLIEAIHDKLQIRNWGHSVMVMLKPK